MFVRQHPVWYLNTQDSKTSCLHEIKIQIFQKIWFGEKIDQKLNSEKSEPNYVLKAS